MEDLETGGGRGRKSPGLHLYRFGKAQTRQTLCSYSCEEPVPFIRLLLFIPLPLLFIRAPLPLMPGPLLFVTETRVRRMGPEDGGF